MVPEDVTEILLQLAGYGSLSVDQERSDALLLHEITADSQVKAHSLDGLSRIATDHEFLITNVSKLRKSASVIVRAAASEIARHMQYFATFVAEVDKLIIQGHTSVYADGELSLIKLETVFTRPGHILAHLKRVALDLLAADSSADDYKPVDLQNQLRADILTGYDDLKDVTRSLLQSVDTILMLHIKKWCLRGQLYSSFKDDFFVQKDVDGSHKFVEENCPTYVGALVGKQIYDQGTLLLKILEGSHGLQSADADVLDNLRTNESVLEGIVSPIDHIALSAALATIEQSLSLHTLRKLLPKQNIIHLLTFMQEYFLLSNGQFASALIDRVEQDFKSMRKTVAQIKDSTVQALLAKTLSSLKETDESAQSGLDLTSSLKVSLVKDYDSNERPFSDLLFGVPVEQGIKLQWPLDVFLPKDDQQVYSDVFSYLIALRRGHERLHGLWRGRRSGSYNDNISNATWAAAYRARSFIETLLEYYHADVIDDFAKRATTMVTTEQHLYDPSRLAREHSALLHQTKDRIVLRQHNFDKIMRKLLIGIDQMVATIQQPDEVVKERCNIVLQTIDRAVDTLTMMKGVEALLLRLQIGTPPPNGPHYYI